MQIRQRTAAVVHLDRLAANIENIRGRLAAGTDLIAVLKGDAYGHGIEGIYPTLRACGVRRYAVAVWEEGASLRRAGAEEESVMLLGDIWDDQLPMLLEHRITPAIFSVETAEKLDALARAAGVVHPIQIKLDTGMNRIGFPADGRAVAPVKRIAAMENLRIEGAFTHFARADEPDGASALRQLERFERTVALLRENGVEIPFLHIANSPALLLRPETRLDAVRVGDVLFGLCPVDGDAWAREGFEDVMTWQTYVALVKTVPAGEQVGYGGTFETKRETVVATLPVGFADGYDRRLSNRGLVSIRGQLAPVIGRVCMDQCMVDVTDIPGVRRGDPATLLGGELSILWMADLLGVNVDEIVCGVSKRVPRLYTKEEE